MTDDVEREVIVAAIDWGDSAYGTKKGRDATTALERALRKLSAARAAEQREPGKLSPEWLHQLPKVPAQPTTAELVETVRKLTRTAKANNLFGLAMLADAALTELARRAGEM